MLMETNKELIEKCYDVICDITTGISRLQYYAAIIDKPLANGYSDDIRRVYRDLNTLFRYVSKIK